MLRKGAWRDRGVLVTSWGREKCVNLGSWGPTLAFSSHFSPDSSAEALTACSQWCLFVQMGPWKFWGSCVKDCLYIRRSVPIKNNERGSRKASIKETTWWHLIVSRLITNMSKHTCDSVTAAGGDRQQIIHMSLFFHSERWSAKWPLLSFYMN